MFIQFQLEKPERSRSLEDLFVGGSIILKWIYRKRGWGLDSSDSGECQVAASCEHGN
jgi:hypothetical protein